MNNSKKCIVCQNNQKLCFDYQGYYYYRCSSCDLVSTYPLPTNRDIKTNYKKKFNHGNYQLLRINADQYRQIYKGYARELQRILKRKKNNLNKLKVLDIGCFTGGFLEIIKEKGADVYGIELQKEAASIANLRLGRRRVLQKDVMNYDFKNKKFDVITMFGLVEHVTNPSALIKKSYRLLNKGGILMIQTPNSASFLARILGKYWPPFSPIEHIHLFSQKSLTTLLEATGYRITLIKGHVKPLPLGYVYDMLDNFGSEFKILFKPLQSLLPFVRNVTFSFYIGEMIVIARKT